MEVEVEAEVKVKNAAAQTGMVANDILGAVATAAGALFFIVGSSRTLAA